MKHLIQIFVLFLTLSTLVACSALASALPFVDSALSETSQVLAFIDTAFDAYQSSHPVTPAERLEYDRLRGACYQALNTGTRAVADLHQIDQGQYDAAFKDFKTAYDALHVYLKAHGISPVGSGLVGAGTKGADDFPEPRVIGLKIQS
jgi:hypothetical protein